MFQALMCFPFAFNYHLLFRRRNRIFTTLVQFIMYLQLFRLYTNTICLRHCHFIWTKTYLMQFQCYSVVSSFTVSLMFCHLLNWFANHHFISSEQQNVLSQKVFRYCLFCHYIGELTNVCKKIVNKQYSQKFSFQNCVMFPTKCKHANLQS